MSDTYEDQLKSARYKAERDQARQRLAGLMKSVDDLDDENERLRDMLNDVAWKLGIGYVVHYLSDDNYAECQQAVLAAINRLVNPSDVAQLTHSAYDLLPEEDREALRWVREHGGLEKIIKQRRDSVPRTAFERKLGKRLKHIAECEEALRRRNATISALEKTADLLRKQIADMRPRLMPDGMEWPRYEDNEPVRLGDEFTDHEGLLRKVAKVCLMDDGYYLVSKTGTYYLRTYRQRVKLPAPKVLDADGAPIKVGDTVWNERDCSFKVSGIRPERKDGDSVDCDAGGVTYRYHPDQLTHHRPVLDADGEPIHKGDTVYDVENGTKYEVCEAKLPRVTVEYWCAGISAHSSIVPSLLTHRAPVIAADGKPLLKHETVYEIKTGERYFVTNVFDGMTEPDFPEHTVECRKYEDVVTHMFRPGQLTHQRPTAGSASRRTWATKWRSSSAAPYLPSWHASSLGSLCAAAARWRRGASDGANRRDRSHRG